jgi:hypothetical protein
MRIVGRFLAGALGLVASPALCQFALKAPTDAELRAYYCLAVENHMDPSNKLAADNAERLRAYIIPRLPNLNMFPMALAQKRAEADLADSGQAPRRRVAACRKIDWLPF